MESVRLSRFDWLGKPLLNCVQEPRCLGDTIEKIDHKSNMLFSIGVPVKTIVKLEVRSLADCTLED